jgi:hypothetical protein
VHSATVPCSRLLNCISRLLTHGITSTSSHIQFNHHHFTASHSFRIEHLSPLLGKSCINTIQYTPSPLFDTRMRREPDATSRSSTASTLLRNPNISALSYTQILPDLIHLRIQRSCDLISKFTTRLADQTAQILGPFFGVRYNAQHRKLDHHNNTICANFPSQIRSGNGSTVQRSGLAKDSIPQSPGALYAVNKRSLLKFVGGLILTCTLAN